MDHHSWKNSTLPALFDDVQIVFSHVQVGYIPLPRWLHKVVGGLNRVVFSTREMIPTTEHIFQGGGTGREVTHHSYNVVAPSYVGWFIIPMKV